MSEKLSKLWHLLTVKDSSVLEWLCRRQLFNNFCKAEAFVSVYAVTRGNWNPNPSCICHTFTFITFCILWHLLMVDDINKILFYCCWMWIQTVKIPWLNNLKKKITEKIVDKVTKAISAMYSWFGLCCNSCTLINGHQKEEMNFPFNTSKWINNSSSSQSKTAKWKAEYTIGLIFLMSIDSWIVCRKCPGSFSIASSTFDLH